MREFYVGLLTPDGLVHWTHVEAETKEAALTAAQMRILLKSTHERSARVFSMEEGKMTSQGWSKFYNVSF